jgi:hypothetical protein
MMRDKQLVQGLYSVSIMERRSKDGMTGLMILPAGHRGWIMKPLPECDITALTHTALPPHHGDRNLAEIKVPCTGETGAWQ